MHGGRQRQSTSGAPVDDDFSTRGFSSELDLTDVRANRSEGLLQNRAVAFDPAVVPWLEGCGEMPLSVRPTSQGVLH